MKSKLAIAAVLAVGAFGAAAFAAGTLNSSIQPKSASVERGGVDTSVTATFFSRGNNRILSVDDGDPTNGTIDYVITGNQELLARQLIISNAYYSAGVAESGGLTITLLGQGGAPSTLLFYPFSTYAAQQFDFNPPIALRAGDTVSFFYRNVGSPTGYLQAAFHGEAITGATGFVAR